MSVDQHSHVPIYLQIVELLRGSIASGVYRPGEALPSLRVLATDLKVNPNTVQKAFDELERAGLIATRRGVGVFVARRGDSSAQTRTEAAVREALRGAVRTARAGSMEPDRVREVFEESLDHVYGSAEEKR